MDTIVPNPDNFSQDYSTASASLDKFGKDYAEYVNQCCYEDVVVRSGVAPDIFRLNFAPTIGTTVYEHQYADSDNSTNSGSSIEADRNFARCEGSKGYFLGSTFYIPSDLAGNTKVARSGTIKSKGISRPAGPPAYGWIGNNRFRQLGGAPLALDQKKGTGVWEPRRYHQRKGQPLEVFLPRVTVRVWKLVATKAGLPMPEFPVVGIDGEAIGFWKWVKATNCPIVLTEGEKKACALISRGYAAIGLPGIYTGYRVTEYGEEVTKPDGTTYRKAIARELCKVLQILDTPGREITILFDYRDGDYSQSPEFKAACTTAKLFKSAIAKIAQLPGPDKGVDDFLVSGGDIDAVIGEASQNVSEDWQLKKWERFRKFSPDIKINSERFDAPAPEPGKITAGRSGFGTGKTYWIGDKVASDPRGLQINLGYRNSLLFQQSKKWGFYHWDEHKGYLFTKDPNARLSLCVDSLLKLPIEMFEAAVESGQGFTVIIDEPVSVSKHLILSKTLLGKRVETLERLEYILKLPNCRLVLTDGNLSDLVVNYFSEISGKPLVKIENVYQGDTLPLFFVDPGKKSKKWLSDQILKSPCPAIATDSLRDAEAFAKQLTESHGAGVLFTSKTAPTEEMEEFKTDPDAWIKRYKPAWVVYTPTAESGFDVSIPGYFSDVFCWNVGVLGVDEFCQMARRVRHPERIVVLCAERGLPSKSAGGLFESDIIKALAEFGDTEARLLVEDESQLQKVREDLAAQIVNPHTILWAKLQAKAELERSHLREYLIKAFEACGYSVQQVSASECDYEGHAFAKEECKDIESQEIFNAPDIELSKALEIKLNFKATWEDRCCAIKFFLKARLPGIENSGLWDWEFVRRVRFDDRSLLSQLDSDWIYQNPEDAEFLQRHRLSTGKREFLGDFSPRWLKIKALKALGLEKFLEPGKVWTQESPEVLELLERCKKKAIANLFGHPGKMKPIQWLNKLLQLIGRKLIGKNVKQNGVQHREYSFMAEASLPENWHQLAAFTAEKQAKKISEIKEAETHAAQESEAVAPPPVFDTNIGVDATEDLEAFSPKTAIEVEAPATEIFVAQIEVTSPELPAVEVPIAAEAPIAQKAWGWFQRKLGEWIKCRVLEFVEGRYLLEAKSMVDSGMIQFRAYPEDLRWEAPIC
ncbi:DUF3854 domain-containing protein [Microcoleus sp. S36b_A4]|uniref:plasmid replication protein, CyRepA1 family n=1 Tax=Microcoleus sp. S36b_A4 TaxID=3055420 RepID=UPI002FD1D0BC